MSVIYWFFGLLDWVVYSISAVLVRVIVSIANVDLFTYDKIQDIVDKVYVIIGVLMLFKIVISAIQYIVNPDTFDDKEKGLAGLLKKTVISLSLIVLVPVIFDFAMKVQEPIIESLPRIILSDGVDIDKTTSDIGEEVSFQVLKSFVTVKENRGEDEITDIASFQGHIADGCLFFDNGDRCKYQYMIVISTLCGGFLCYVLLSLTLDVAVRTIKLGIIKILAPIPISSYIYSKDKLNKFFKTASQVYADLFIRMAIIYFIIFAIELIFDSELFKRTEEDAFMNLVVHLALIFGLLMFAKSAPKFLSELLGLPDIGSGDMKDMFKPAWQRSGALRAITGTGGAGLANMLNKIAQDPGKSFGQRLKNTLKDKKARRAMFGSGIAGASSAAFHGGLAALQGKEGKDVRAAGYKRAVQARINRALDKALPKDQRPTVFSRAMAKATDDMGITTAANLAEDRIKAEEAIQKNIGSSKSLGRDVLQKKGFDVNVNLTYDTATKSTATGNKYIADLGKSLQNYIKSSGTKDAGLIDLATRMTTGGAVSYEELMSLRKFAGQRTDDFSMNSISTALDDTNGSMRAIQKNQYLMMKDQKVQDMSGGLNAKVNEDPDLKAQFEANRQSIIENAANLIGVGGTTTTQEVMDMYDDDFASFGDAVTDAISENRKVLASDKMAAARESIKRREANKKENK